jgi:transcriptional regulator with PAS, ATPase and Fis domain
MIAALPGRAAQRENGLSALVGESAPMFSLKALIGKIIDADIQLSGTDSPAVLITGETGTGKELVARALHFEGRHCVGPFIEINCACIPAALLEAELFGHERGAFTDAKEAKPGLIESAAGGTLFLDEIGDLDLASQAKLLKVLEERRVRRLGSLKERSVDTRVLAATSCDLEAMVREGRFRADLYYRLRMIRVHVPALRERGVDVVRLAEHFLAIHGARYGKPGLRLSSDAMAALNRHVWEGNVRELKNTIEQAIILVSGDVIGVGDLSIRIVGKEDRASVSQIFDRHDSMNLHKVEREMLVAALHQARANVSKAARMLGISRDTLRYRAKKLEIVC